MSFNSKLKMAAWSFMFSDWQRFQKSSQNLCGGIVTWQISNMDIRYIYMINL